MVVRWLLAWAIFYLLTFPILVALGLMSIRQLQEFFLGSPRLVDHLFAIVISVVVFALSSLIVFLLHRGRNIRWLILKVVAVSSALYIPIALYLYRLMTIT